MSMYILKIIAAFMGWLLQKGLVTAVVILILAALACSCLLCTPLLVACLLVKYSSRKKNQNNGKGKDAAGTNAGG
ncbi:MAG: hypothetical protein JST19_10450 [Bacteroidetes bacterium]|nr:hypothetical protein [Bacteroidota bacterium]